MRSVQVQIKTAAGLPAELQTNRPETSAHETAVVQKNTSVRHIQQCKNRTVDMTIVSAPSTAQHSKQDHTRACTHEVTKLLTALLVAPL